MDQYNKCQITEKKLKILSKESVDENICNSDNEEFNPKENEIMSSGRNKRTRTRKCDPDFEYSSTQEVLQKQGSKNRMEQKKCLNDKDNQTRILSQIRKQQVDIKFGFLETLRNFTSFVFQYAGTRISRISSKFHDINSKRI